MFDPKSLHKYIYAAADPVNKIDLSGYSYISMSLAGIFGGKILAGFKAAATFKVKVPKVDFFPQLYRNPDWTMPIYHFMNQKNNLLRSSTFGETSRGKILADTFDLYYKYTTTDPFTIYFLQSVPTPIHYFMIIDRRNFKRLYYERVRGEAAFDPAMPAFTRILIKYWDYSKSGGVPVGEENKHILGSSNRGGGEYGFEKAELMYMVYHELLHAAQFSYIENQILHRKVPQEQEIDAFIAGKNAALTVIGPGEWKDIDGWRSFWDVSPDEGFANLREFVEDEYSENPVDEEYIPLGGPEHDLEYWFNYP
jgi:hypothetical protein